MKKILQLGFLLLGALALSFTLSIAEGKCSQGKCGNSTKEMKGKCGNSTKEMKDTHVKCGGEKKAPVKGKCGQGKCG